MRHRSCVMEWVCGRWCRIHKGYASLHETFTLFTRTILNWLLIGLQESDLYRFTINRFLAAFTRTRLNRFYVSCEGGVL